MPWSSWSLLRIPRGSNRPKCRVSRWTNLQSCTRHPAERSMLLCELTHSQVFGTSWLFISLLDLLDNRNRLSVQSVDSKPSEKHVGPDDTWQHVLCTHVSHHIWRGPDLFALLLQCAHGIIELDLITTCRVDLSRIATHDHRIKAFDDFAEGLMLLRDIVDQLAAHARCDHAIGNGNRVIAMTTVALVGSSKRLGRHIDLDQCGLVLWLQWLRQESHIIGLGNLVCLSWALPWEKQEKPKHWH